MIPRNDNLLIGLLASIAIPLIVFALLLQAQDWFSDAASRSITFRPRSLALMALCLNIVPMNYFRKRYQNKSLRGLVIGTMILAAAWFVYFGRELI